jgi:hypothetical protein
VSPSGNLGSPDEGLLRVDQREFCRKVGTTLAQQLVTGLDKQVLADLFTICSDGLSLLAFGDKTKTAEFRAVLRQRKLLLEKLESLTDQLQYALKTTSPAVLTEADFRFKDAVVELSDIIQVANARRRALESMSRKARRESYPGALSLSLNDYLRLHHGLKWNQHQRDLIIAACLQACRVYPPKDSFAEIVDRVAMQRSREARRTAREGGRFVHKPGAGPQFTAALNDKIMAH